ncbi:hypothetical protein FYJ53_20735 [Eubacterium sp. BL-380-WT-2B]|uniref:hypothetical protein n=1 Tax=Eubacterium sp. BL-380-WT-2B TaxID=2605785 RepID=UPI0012B43587|nr:hypothetical protein [Eubacterium sp. BL-380-WT-2B]MSS96182.1 hypothetical protein [Eubacterium sp. BL-380-WT-2B]
MSKNYMPEVAKMLGVEIGEEFDVLDEDGEIRDCGPYKFTNETIVNRLGHEASGWLLFCLLAGKYTLQKRPWRPKDEEEYWAVLTNGDVGWRCFRKGNANSLASLYMGNCFPTEEAALAAVTEMLAKFEEIKKEVEE